MMLPIRSLNIMRMTEGGFYLEIANTVTEGPLEYLEQKPSYLPRSEVWLDS